MLNIEETINEVVERTLSLTDSSLDSETELDALGIDSIEKAEIMTKLQKEFGVRFEMKVFQTAKTMQDFYQLTQLKLQEKKTH